ncbi:hypothetical protein UP06_14265 [Bradyrhizobium sp. LTSP857]|nr:hypothetical protein UP06_14265 [Bradyrhizobium sp. LTSP857]
MQEYNAGKVTDYSDGDRKVIVCGDMEVGASSNQWRIYVWHNRCTHRAGPIRQNHLNSVMFLRACD